MIPTALRGPDTADVIWPLYASKLADAIGASAGVSADEGGDDLDTILLWVEAIKQHYGPGTAFLDVTHSLGIAAWFALHQLEWVESQAVYGPPGPYDPRTDSIGLHMFGRHLPFEGDAAFLYVMDARSGTAAHERAHGTLFDLALAPSAFSSSARIRAQEACLIFASADVDGGDLKSLFVPGTPFRIARPLEGCPQVNWSTNQLFPPASEDDWYARFVAVPLVPNLRRSQAHTVFDHPIAVTLYVPDGAGEVEDRALLDDLSYRFVVPRPPLFYADLATSSQAWLHGQLAEAFADATPLLLEGPMMTVLPPIERINSGLLLTGLADSAPVADFVSGKPAGEVTLNNVFIEVSALDAAGWETAESESTAVEVIRGIWLVRENDAFRLMVFVRGQSDYTIGPVEIAFDGASSSYLLRGGAPGARWLPLRDFDLIERAFIKALTFVRALSPCWKLSASAQLEVGQAGGRHRSFARCEWALGEILSLRRLKGPVGFYYALRQWGRDEPFYGDVRLESPATEGGLTAEGQPFARIRADELLESVATELARRPPPALPSRRAVREVGGVHRDDMIEAAEAVVDDLRERTDEDSASTPLLAAALDSLAGAYSRAGREADGLTAAEEAVEFFRATPDKRGRFAADFAAAVANLAISYSSAGRANDALPPAEEAVRKYRELAASDSSYKADLGRALNNLGNCYAAVGHYTEAVRVTEEAVEIGRRLAVESPEYGPSLAGALSNLGGRYRGAGRPDDSLAVTEEGVAVYRALSTDDLDAHGPNFSTGLRNLAASYNAAGRDREAIACAEEAVQVLGRLAARDGMFAPVLAEALGELGGFAARMQATS
jgi:tetratricopeptide (TPR) repeat protein